LAWRCSSVRPAYFGLPLQLVEKQVPPGSLRAVVVEHEHIVLGQVLRHELFDIDGYRGLEGARLLAQDLEDAIHVGHDLVVEAGAQGEHEHLAYVGLDGSLRRSGLLHLRTPLGGGRNDVRLRVGNLLGKPRGGQDKGKENRREEVAVDHGASLAGGVERDE
jgi:hypothetical protein